MDYAKEFLKEELDRLNWLYNKYVQSGEVKSDSSVANENRKKVKSIEKVLLILSKIEDNQESL